MCVPHEPFQPHIHFRRECMQLPTHKLPQGVADRLGAQHSSQQLPIHRREGNALVHSSHYSLKKPSSPHLYIKQQRIMNDLLDNNKQQSPYAS